MLADKCGPTFVGQLLLAVCPRLTVYHHPGVLSQVMSTTVVHGPLKQTWNRSRVTGSAIWSGLGRVTGQSPDPAF